MKIITKKRQAEIDAVTLRKLQFVARIVYERYGVKTEDGSMKNEFSALARIAKDIFWADDVIAGY